MTGLSAALLEGFNPLGKVLHIMLKVLEFRASLSRSLGKRGEVVPRSRRSVLVAIRLES
jgi:hypothetical protein